MARKKKQAAVAAVEPEVEQPEVETEAAAPEPTPPEPVSAEPVAAAPVVAKGKVVRVVEAKASYTDDEQAAYFGANLTADQDNIKPYADIHDWYRRTGGKVGA